MLLLLRKYIAVAFNDHVQYMSALLTVSGLRVTARAIVQLFFIIF